jgi:hypothetical protein
MEVLFPTPGFVLKAADRFAFDPGSKVVAGRAAFCVEFRPRRFQAEKVGVGKIGVLKAGLYYSLGYS